MDETKAERIQRLKREIAQRQMELQWLVLGNPTERVSFPSALSPSVSEEKPK